MGEAPRDRGRDSERRREAEQVLLDAAASLLTEGSALSEISVEQIATRAGRPRTAFYLYFADKTELLMRLAEEVAAELYGQAELWWSASDGHEEMRPALEAILGTFRAHDTLLRAVVEASTYEPRIAELYGSIIGRFVTATAKRLEAEGAAPERGEAKAFALVWMTERSCYEQVSRPSQRSDAELVGALVDVWECSVYA